MERELIRCFRLEDSCSHVRNVGRQRRVLNIGFDDDGFGAGDDEFVVGIPGSAVGIFGGVWGAAAEKQRFVLSVDCVREKEKGC